MITGLTKKQKTTSIFFDEHSSTVEILTHNTDMKKRLTKYAAEHPDLCRQTDDNGQGGLEFEIEKGRFSVRRSPDRTVFRGSAAAVQQAS